MDMKLYESGSLQEAEILKVQLERAGFKVSVKGIHLSGALGELPASAETSPSLWVTKQDYEKAVSFLKELQRESQTDYPAWKCPDCGEPVEGSILTCWNCGYEIENPNDVQMRQKARSTEEKPDRPSSMPAIDKSFSWKKVFATCLLLLLSLSYQGLQEYNYLYSQISIYGVLSAMLFSFIPGVRKSAAVIIFVVFFLATDWNRVKFESRFNDAVKLEKEGNIPGAIEELQSALGIGIAGYQVHAYIADLYLQISYLDSSFDHYEKALSLFPNDDYSLLGQADIHFLRGEFKESKKALLQAQNINPQNPSTLTSLALSAEVLEGMNEAKLIHEKAIGYANNSDDYTWGSYAYFLKDIGEYDKAQKIATRLIERLDAGIKNSENLFQNYYTRGQAYEVIGDMVSARRDLLKSTALNKRNEASMTALAWAELRLGNLRDARLFFEESLKLVEKSPFALIGYTLTLAKLKDKEKALSYMQIIESLIPRFWLTHKVLADCYKELGDLRMSVKHAKLGLRFNPYIDGK